MPVFSSTLPDIDIPSNISLPEFIIQNFSLFPQDRKLLIDPFSKRSYTPPQIINAINKVSAGFHNKGLKKGDVVALYLPNLIDYPIILFGIMSLGGIPTTINPSYTTEELTYQLKDSNAQYLITISQLMDKVNGTKEKVTLKEIFSLDEANGASSFSSLINNDGKFPEVKFDPKTTVAVIPYSSGTTGLPMGVELTHYNIISNIVQINSVHDGLHNQHETLLGFLPFFHTFAMVVLLSVSLRSGFTLIILPKFEILQYLQFIQEYKVTVLHVVPPVVLLLNNNDAIKKHDLSSVKTVICSAAPLSAAIENKLRSRLKGVIIIQLYGLTENSNTAKSQVPGHIGQLVPNMKFKVFDADSGKEVGPGGTGELWVSGPNTMKGYLNNPSATKNAIDSDGFLHTGDIVHLDEESNCYVVDRMKELIKYKGFQVAPAELEALLLRHPAIADAAVLGVPDKEAGELPTAFIVLKKGKTFSPSEIISWAEKKTAPHKKLRGGVVIVQSIPKSASGKILRKLLRARL